MVSTEPTYWGCATLSNGQPVSQGIYDPVRIHNNTVMSNSLKITSVQGLAITRQVKEGQVLPQRNFIEVYAEAAASQAAEPQQHCCELYHCTGFQVAEVMLGSGIVEK